MDKKIRISAIAAIGIKTRSLGKGNELLWRISDDLKRFKSITFGYPVIMGRKTYESIGHPLMGRLNIVVTRSKENDNTEHPLLLSRKAKKVSSVSNNNLVIAHSVDEALAIASKQNSTEIFIIGGGEIYRQLISRIDRLYLTLVESDKTGDVFFPDYSEFTKVIEKEVRQSNGLTYTWLTLER